MPKKKPEVSVGAQRPTTLTKLELGDLKLKKHGYPPSRALINYFEYYLTHEFHNLNYAKFYILTISPHYRYSGDTVLHHAAKEILHKYKSVYSLRYIIETSLKGKLHIHGIVVSRDYNKFVKLRKNPVVQYKLEQYIDCLSWLSYISKDKPTTVYGYEKTRKMIAGTAEPSYEYVRPYFTTKKSLSWD